MLLNKTSEYGIRAMLYLAQAESEGYISAGEIGDRLDISAHFLTKIMQQLTAAGLVKSYRGPNGGLALARSARNISVRDIYAALEGEDLFTECVLGLPECGRQKPCPFHDRWASARDRIEKMMTAQSLADLGEDLRSGTYRLRAL
jgi:Rrf2 family protein